MRGRPDALVVAISAAEILVEEEIRYGRYSRVQPYANPGF